MSPREEQLQILLKLLELKTVEANEGVKNENTLTQLAIELDDLVEDPNGNIVIRDGSIVFLTKIKKKNPVILDKKSTPRKRSNEIITFNNQPGEKRYFVISPERLLAKAAKRLHKEFSILQE